MVRDVRGMTIGLKEDDEWLVWLDGNSIHCLSGTERVVVR